jgi:hypothetical protein
MGAFNGYRATAVSTSGTSEPPQGISNYDVVSYRYVFNGDQVFHTANLFTGGNFVGLCKARGLKPENLLRVEKVTKSVVIGYLKEVHTKTEVVS